MKNFKAILLIAIVAVSSLGFNSCKKDSETHPMVGTWEYRENNGPASAVVTYVIKETGTYHFSVDDPTNLLGLGLGIAYYTEIGSCVFSHPSIMFYGGGSRNLSSGTALVSYPQFTLGGNLANGIGGTLIFNKK